jgi:hypothetical protein
MKENKNVGVAVLSIASMIHCLDKPRFGGLHRALLINLHNKNGIPVSPRWRPLSGRACREFQQGHS